MLLGILGEGDKLEGAGRGVVGGRATVALLLVGRGHGHDGYVGPLLALVLRSGPFDKQLALHAGARGAGRAHLALDDAGWSGEGLP